MSIGLIKRHVTKTHVAVEVCFHAFLTSVLVGGEWSVFLIGPHILVRIGPRDDVDTTAITEIPSGKLKNCVCTDTEVL